MKALILQMKGKRDLYIEQGRGEFPRTVTDAFLEEFDTVTAAGMIENPPPVKKRGSGKAGALLHRLSKHRDSFCPVHP